MSLDNVHEQHLLHHMMLMKICSEDRVSIKITATLKIISKQHSFLPELQRSCVIQLHDIHHARFISSLENASFATVISPLCKQPEGFTCGLFYVKGRKTNFLFITVFPHSPTHQQHRGLGRLLPVVIQVGQFQVEQQSVMGDHVETVCVHQSLEAEI